MNEDVRSGRRRHQRSGLDTKCPIQAFAHSEREASRSPGASGREDLMGPAVVDMLGDAVGLVGPVVAAGSREALPQSLKMLKAMGPLSLTFARHEPSLAIKYGTDQFSLRHDRVKQTLTRSAREAMRKNTSQLLLKIPVSPQSQSRRMTQGRRLGDRKPLTSIRFRASGSLALE